MLYACRECLYVFESKAKPEQCPDCGKYAVRDATEKQAAEYMDYKNSKECEAV